MLRWAGVPAVVFVLAFAGSLTWLMVDQDDDPGGAPTRARGAPVPADGTGRLVVTYTPAVDDADNGFVGSLRLDGSGRRNLVEPRAGEPASNGSPAVSPSARSVAFQRAIAGPNGPGVPFIYLMPLDGSRAEARLTGGAAPEIDPAWSPDGERIAFARQVHGRFELFSCRLDGSGLARLTNTPKVDEVSPAWSPDGARIAFSRYESGLEHGSGDLWTADAEGGRERMLLGDVHDYAGASWSPDGRRIALLKDSMVAVMDADGGAPRPLTRAGDFKESRPHWSADGRRLAFTRDPGKILTMDSDGTHLRRTPFDASANGVDWVPAR